LYNNSEKSDYCTKFLLAKSKKKWLSLKFGVREVRISKLGPSPLCQDTVLYCCSLSIQMLGSCRKPWPFPLSPSCTIIDATSKISRCAILSVIFVHKLFLQKLGRSPFINTMSSCVISLVSEAAVGMTCIGGLSDSSPDRPQNILSRIYTGYFIRLHYIIGHILHNKLLH